LCNKNEDILNKINEIKDLKDQYILRKDPSIITKIKIACEEAKTLSVFETKEQKITIISNIQKIGELTYNLYEYDVAIGFSKTDGVIGKMKIAINTYESNLNKLRSSIIEEANKTALYGYLWLSIAFIALLLSLFLLYNRIDRFIHRPLQKLSFFIQQLVRGKLPDKINFRLNDEIAQMSEYLNNVVDGLKQKANFAIEIGQNKLTSSYQPLSEDDILGNALIEMQKSLQKAEQEDIKYKNEEKKRIWTNEGLAKFSDILRQNNDNIHKLSDEVIQNLVKYLNAIQGAIYFINEEDPNNIFIELLSAYAFDRKKYIKQNIQFGEGLIGTVALEKETMFITDIPKDYLTITSGLGESQPKSILIVPLKQEEKIIGIVELASFNIFETHEIEFVEKIGQTIASTVTTVRINAQTAKLLEKSQKQAEEMAEQEEEMRQNMEELRTTQEDFARRETELQGLLKAINEATMLLSTDNEGKIIEINDKLVTFLHAKADDVINRNISEFSSLNEEEWSELWKKILSGKANSISEIIRISTGDELFVQKTFTPIFDKNKEITKILVVFADYTQHYMQNKTLEYQTNENLRLSNLIQQTNTAIDTSLLRCEISNDERIIDVNDNYCRVLGKTKDELIGKIYSATIKDDEKDQFNLIFNELSKGKAYTGSIKRTKPTGEEVWLMASFVPIYDPNNTIQRIVMLAQDITERKLKYQLLEEANKEIERLKKERKNG